MTMKLYKAPHPVQAGGVYYPAGEVFPWEPQKVKGENDKETMSKPGDSWEVVTAKDAAAIEASTNEVPDDANLEAASKAALEAVAIMKHVPIAGLDKPALITAIKAAYAPNL
jgi:hypothetical protein